MALQNITLEEYKQLGTDLKELKRLNNLVHSQLSRVCGRRYAEIHTFNDSDFNNISYDLESKMKKEYPDSKAEAMRMFY